MTSTTIRIAIRSLPAHLDRSRIDTILDQIEITLADDGGVYGFTCADSMTISVEVPTHQLADAASALAAAKFI